MIFGNNWLEDFAPKGGTAMWTIGLRISALSLLTAALALLAFVPGSSGEAAAQTSRHTMDDVMDKLVEIDKRLAIVEVEVKRNTERIETVNANLTKQMETLSDRVNVVLIRLLGDSVLEHSVAYLCHVQKYSQSGESARGPESAKGSRGLADFAGRGQGACRTAEEAGGEVSRRFASLNRCYVDPASEKKIGGRTVSFKSWQGRIGHFRGNQEERAA